MEGFFAKLAKRRLKHGVFDAWPDLQAAVNRFVAVTTMSRAALLQRPSMQSPKSDQALTALCAGCSQLARRLSDPAPACMGECAYVTKPEQPRNLRYM